MLALARVMMSKPRLLMIDELAFGLAPMTVERLMDIVRRVNAEGATVILVEQSVNRAMTLAEHAFFLERGEVRFDGSITDLLSRRRPSPSRVPRQCRRRSRQRRPRAQRHPITQRRPVTQRRRRAAAPPAAGGTTATPAPAPAQGTEPDTPHADGLWLAGPGPDGAGKDGPGTDRRDGERRDRRVVPVVGHPRGRDPGAQLRAVGDGTGVDLPHQPGHQLRPGPARCGRGGLPRQALLRLRDQLLGRPRGRPGPGRGGGRAVGACAPAVVQPTPGHGHGRHHRPVPGPLPLHALPLHPAQEALPGLPGSRRLDVPHRDLPVPARGGRHPHRGAHRGARAGRLHPVLALGTGHAGLGRELRVGPVVRACGCDAPPRWPGRWPVRCPPSPPSWPRPARRARSPRCSVPGSYSWPCWPR